MIELEQVTYFRERKPPTLKQFLVRRAVSEAAAGAKGEKGVSFKSGTPIPKSAEKIGQKLSSLKDLDRLAADHPEWVKEFEKKYGKQPS